MKQVWIHYNTMTLLLEEQHGQLVEPPHEYLLQIEKYPMGHFFWQRAPVSYLQTALKTSFGDSGVILDDSLDDIIWWNCFKD